MQESPRAHGRQYDQLREITISYNVFGYAPGSALFELGDTKILCSVSIMPGVPHFLKGTKTGWLTAEYAMLPTSGQNRLARESTQAKRNDRAVEISRLIGRSLRSIVNLAPVGERTIFVDCDVLQADGSTRTASITGAYLALHRAVDQWIANGDLEKTIITDMVAGVSVGVANGKPLLDLDYQEDTLIDADYNFVFTQSEKIIEIQGTAEKKALSWHEFDQIKALAIQGNKKIFTIMQESLQKVISAPPCPITKTEKVPLFSLKNRLASNVS